MIVQFLNGKQLDVSHLPFGEVYSYILSNQKDLGIEVLITSQIRLLHSNTQTDLWYAFIKPLVEIHFEKAMKAISKLKEREERHRVISLYHQHMADEHFFHYLFQENLSYTILSSDMEEMISTVTRSSRGSKRLSKEEFNNPPVGHNEKIAEKGYMVYKHWVEIEGEEFAISTVINDSDYTEL